MKRAIFLDRDGVVNEVLSKRVKFVNKPEQFYLLEGVGEGIKQLKDAGYYIFVVTNQGGIGLGYMKEEMLHKVHKKMVRLIEEAGGRIDDIAYCPHKPYEGCACRKPEAEMINRLAEKYDIQLNESYMIGDRDVDILAGKKAGTRTIMIGQETENADFRFSSLLEAAKWIVAQNN